MYVTEQNVQNVPKVRRNGQTAKKDAEGDTCLLPCAS